jgi:hypothetical protein
VKDKLSELEKDGIVIANNFVDSSLLQEIAKGTRSKSNEIKFSEPCRILRVDSSLEEGFKVDVLSESGNRFSATLKDDFFHRKEKRKQILTDAFWGKENVLISASAKELRDSISSAVITDVHKIEGDQK